MFKTCFERIEKLLKTGLTKSAATVIVDGRFNPKAYGKIKQEQRRPFLARFHNEITKKRGTVE